MYKKTEQGLSLLEVSAATIILTVGLLGLATLHLKVLKKSHESFYQEVASVQASDLIDRMRSNLDGVTQGYYETSPSLPSSNNLNCLGGIDNGGSQRAFSNTSCNAQQIAQQDLVEWKNNVTSMLPSGQATLCRSSNPGTVGQTVTCNGLGNLYVLSITWLDSIGGKEEYRVSFKP